MNKELAMRTFAYLISNYKENNETTINSEEIEAIEFLIKENQSLKKQLEDLQETIILLKASKPMLEYKKALEKNQQKEFIEYLENESILHPQYGEYTYYGYRRKIIGEILSKYKEIIGGKDEI